MPLHLPFSGFFANFISIMSGHDDPINDSAKNVIEFSDRSNIYCNSVA